MSDTSYDPSFNNPGTHLGFGFIFRFTRLCWYDGNIVAFKHLLVCWINVMIILTCP